MSLRLSHNALPRKFPVPKAKISINPCLAIRPQRNFLPTLQQRLTDKSPHPFGRDGWRLGVQSAVDPVEKFVDWPC